MFAGHFGLAAAVKTKNTKVPLWALMLSTHLLDVLFVPLLIMNIESMSGVGYGNLIVHAYYSHSLVSAILIALIAGLLSWRFWGRPGGLLVAAVVFSHWLLDLLVHTADLPILPGNVGNLPLLGLGLWQFPYVSLALEGVLIIVGSVMYFASARARAKNQGTNQQWAIFASMFISVLMVAALITDFMGLS